MIDSIVQMKLELEMLKSVVGQSMKVGPVAKVDAEKGYRIALGKDDQGNDFLSPWIPHPESAKSSIPLKVGQTVGVMAPGGDLSQGVLIRAGYSKGQESPNNDMDANVFEDAGVKVSVVGGALTIVAGGVSVVISSSGLAVSGGTVRHNGKNIGDDHVHTNVETGPSLSGPPNG
ncbi:baseplate assembly protein [uncultured Cohaesibacter sp.]|uniref:baseplate assembly protein n=1 Tax=uncultured Cohaesibacter sp. TaxID=1002546 RepID=UPI0029C72D38|nr:baseplate assembly protein [uncultured Cohaesibacter sp.]